MQWISNIDSTLQSLNKILNSKLLNNKSVKFVFIKKFLMSAWKFLKVTVHFVNHMKYNLIKQFNLSSPKCYHVTCTWIYLYVSALGECQVFYSRLGYSNSVCLNMLY